MLLPDRDAIFETIRLQFPDVEPLATIETWVAGMSGKTIGFELNDQNRSKQLARSDLFHPLFLRSPLREARAA